VSWLRSPAWHAADYLALDLETTGLDAATASVLSVGTVPIRGGTIRWGERWYSLVRPPRPEEVLNGSLRVHEILPDELAGAPALEEVVPEIERRLAGAVLVVHFRHLDVPLLERCFARCGRRWPKPGVVDTVDLLARHDRRRRLLELEPHATPTQLAEARRALGLPAHREHHALYDALATAELMLLLRFRVGAQRLRDLL